MRTNPSRILAAWSVGTCVMSTHAQRKGHNRDIRVLWIREDGPHRVLFGYSVSKGRGKLEIMWGKPGKDLRDFRVIVAWVEGKCKFSVVKKQRTAVNKYI